MVCGLSETIATFAPTIALTSVDLPTLGRPASATKPDRVGVSLDVMPAEDLALEREHLAVVGLVVHAREVQRAVQDRLALVGRVLGADQHVAELARAGGIASGLVDREGEDVGGQRRSPRCSRLSARMRSASTNSTARWPSRTPADASASAHSSRNSSSASPSWRALQPDDLDLKHGGGGAARSSGAERSAASP